MHWTDLHQHFVRFAPPTFTSIPPDLISLVNVQDSWGQTPLFHAMLVSPENIHMLLRAGANPRINVAILTMAARAGADTAISTLVRAGAYINISDSNDKTALHWAANPGLVYSINGLTVALELVRHAGHLLDWEILDDNERSPLEWAQIRARQNPDDADSRHILQLYHTRRLPTWAEYLQTPPAVDDASYEPSQDDIYGFPLTPLLRAALRGDIDGIGDLIHQGAMVNERDCEDRTLLHLIALGMVPHGYRVALELVRHGGWGVDWDAVAGESQLECGSEETKVNSDEAWDGEGVGCTPLQIAESCLKHKALTEQGREELEKVRDLLKARRLPPDEEYLWPCMDPDFYALRMPGAWD